MQYLVITTQVLFVDDADVVEKTAQILSALKEIFKGSGIHIFNVYTSFVPAQGNHYLKIYVQANHEGGPEITPANLGEIQLKLIEILIPGGSNNFHIVHS